MPHATETSPTPQEPETSPIPQDLESQETLLFFGLHAPRASQIWNKWLDNGQTYHAGDFGLFTQDYLHELVESEDCDIGEPGVDWRGNLRRIGAGEELVEAVMEGYPGDERGVRLTRSAAEWVLQAVEWRWEYLVMKFEGRVTWEN